jgi:uncharacterized small protein (DUF1192 family)
VQRTVGCGLVAGLVVGVAAGHAASRWFARCDAAPAHDPGERRELFGEDSIDPCAPVVGADGSTWTWTSFDESPAAPSATRREVGADDRSPLGELALLHARTSDLEVEVGRLRAALDRKDPRRDRIARLVAANDLCHGELYLDVADLVLIDPESVTEDPSDAFRVLVRLADESGLTAKPAVERHKEHNPERNAPELTLSLVSGEDPTAEWIHFAAALTLPKAPPQWRGSPLDLHVELKLQRSRNGEAFVLLSARGNSFENRTGLEWSEYWNRDSTLIQRCPWNGGRDDRKGGPADFAAFRVVIDDLFEKLKARAR